MRLLLVRPSYLIVEIYYTVNNKSLLRLDHFALLDALNRAYGRYIDRVIYSDLNFALDFYLTHDFVQYFDRVPALARELGFDGLAKEFSALSMQSDISSAAGRQECADKWQALMRKHRDIGHERNLSGTQQAKLNDYLNAIVLLQDCLELAFMPPEEQRVVLESLYLPPGRADGVEG